MSMISSSAGRDRPLLRSSRGLPIALPRAPNHGSRESRSGSIGNPISQETGDQIPLSCGIDYFRSAPPPLPAWLSEFFTDDSIPTIDEIASLRAVAPEAIAAIRECARI